MNIFKKFFNNNKINNSNDVWNVPLKEALISLGNSNSGNYHYSKDQLKSFYSVLVATCIDVRAEAVSQAQLSIRLKNKRTGKYEPLDWHPFLDLVQRPNLTYEDLSFSDILEYYSKTRDISGNVYWHLPMGLDGKRPSEIWPIPFDEMQISKVDSNGVPSEYKRTYYDLSGKYIVKFIPANEIEHFKTYNPYSQYYGMGIIQKSAIKFAINNQLSNYQYKLLKKGGIPKLAILNKNELNPDIVDNQNEQYAQKHGGAQGTIIFNAGYDIKALQLNPAEMDFIVSARFSKEEILNMFRTPGAILGDGGGTNKSTASVNLITFNHLVIRPIVQNLANKLSMYIYKVYGDDVIVDFTIPLPSDPEVTMKQFQIMGAIAKDALTNDYSKQVLNDFRSALKLNVIR